MPDLLDARQGSRKAAPMAKSTKQVVVFHMDGCPACHDYLPRFRRIAVKYRPFIAIKAANISVPSNQEAANKYKIVAAPTTLILDVEGKVLSRSKGALDAKAIEAIFTEALKA
jgi:thiol-disulfide isomerase/thioredoxin